MFTNGSAINNSWSDTTLVDNLRAADITSISSWTSPCVTTDLLVDVTLRHDFVGAGHNGLNQGELRNPDNPDKLLDSAAADKIHHYRAPYRQNRHVAFLPACMTTSGRIHGEFLRLLYFISNKQAVDYFEALGYDAHKEEFCHRHGVFFLNNRCTLGMCPGRCDARRPHCSASPRGRTSKSTALPL